MRKSSISLFFYLVFFSIVLGGCAGISSNKTITDEDLQNEQFFRDQLQKKLSPHLKSVESSALSGSLTLRAVALFYQQRAWQPIWDSQRFTALIKEINALEEDGLNSNDYFLEDLQSCENGKKKSLVKTCENKLDRELLATEAYLLALKHLYMGKVNPAQLDPDWNFSTVQVNGEQGLIQVREALEKNNIDTVFKSARPTLPRYQKIRNVLKGMRLLATYGGWSPLPEGETLESGMKNKRVIYLRKRLQILGFLKKSTVNASELHDPELYDDDLVKAVKNFQRLYSLHEDGVLGKKTLEALNVPIENRIAQLRVNLERMRWSLRDIHGEYIVVDVAGYTVSYHRDGEIIWKSRVQIGQPFRKTPIFQAQVSRISLNPQWTVPPTILIKDILPAIRKDSSYLTKKNIRVFDDKGNPLEANTIDWSHPGNITLRQDSGKDAALGQVAIRFPNPYSIYLHETPYQALFKADQRAFSSGCIRVENVRELAVLLLNDEKKWSREALELALDTGKTREVNLKQKIPILIDYWTVDVDKDGIVSFRPDVYGRDASLLQALDKNE